MITRLRYTKQDNTLISKDTIIKSRVNYFIAIDTLTNTVTLNTKTDDVTNVVETLQSNSLHEAKINAKLILKNLGFEFKKEKRKVTKKSKKKQENELQSQY